jgi:argininosuccinate synthase
MPTSSHISYEGGILEDPAAEPEESMWRWTVSPQNAPDEAEYIEIGYEKGDPVSLNGKALSPAVMLEQLNIIAGRHGIGRADIVENRFVGMKSRGCYETPGGTIMIKAHRAIESLTLDREEAHLKDELMPRYAKLIYNGFWFAPEREMLQAAIDKTQQNVRGTVRLKLYKGNVSWSSDAVQIFRFSILNTVRLKKTLFMIKKMQADLSNSTLYALSLPVKHEKTNKGVRV